MSRDIFFITGEASGDLHAAPVAAALRAQGWHVVGAGGPQMAQAGAEIVADSLLWGAMGVPDSLRKFPYLWVQSRMLLRQVIRRRPAVVVLVDFGTFNSRMALYLRRLGWPRIFHYFPPGSWRQEPRDWSRFAALTDRVATPFARNAEFLRASGIDAHWVGHPAVDALQPVADRIRLRRELGWPAEGPVVGILPGSRIMERQVLGPRFLQAAELIRQRLPQATFVWSAFPRIGRLERRLQARARAMGIEVFEEESHRILQACDLLLVAMGTVTVEAAAALTPMVCAYDGSRLAKWIAGRLLHQAQRFYAMPNLLLGGEAVPEIVPRTPAEAITAQALAEAALGVLEDPQRRAQMICQLRQVRELLGPPGVAKRVAELIIDLAQSNGEE
jgi:lipid-A-disaccharide synthase